MHCKRLAGSCVCWEDDDDDEQDVDDDEEEQEDDGEHEVVVVVVEEQSVLLLLLLLLLEHEREERELVMDEDGRHQVFELLVLQLGKRFLDWDRVVRGIFFKAVLFFS
jgi:hypothetical protein